MEGTASNEFDPRSHALRGNGCFRRSASCFVRTTQSVGRRVPHAERGNEELARSGDYTNSLTSKLHAAHTAGGPIQPQQAFEVIIPANVEPANAGELAFSCEMRVAAEREGNVR
jgi:hypothetical protein